MYCNLSPMILISESTAIYFYCNFTAIAINVPDRNGSSDWTPLRVFLLRLHMHQIFIVGIKFWMQFSETYGIHAHGNGAALAQGIAKRSQIWTDRLCFFLLLHHSFWNGREATHHTPVGMCGIFHKDCCRARLQLGASNPRQQPPRHIKMPMMKKGVPTAQALTLCDSICWHTDEVSSNAQLKNQITMLAHLRSQQHGADE